MKYWELTIYYDINSNDELPFEMRDTIAIRHTSLKRVCENARYLYRPANIYRDWIYLAYRDNDTDRSILYSYDCWKGHSSITKTLLRNMGVTNAADIQKKS